MCYLFLIVLCDLVTEFCFESNFISEDRRVPKHLVIICEYSRNVFVLVVKVYRNGCCVKECYCIHIFIGFFCSWIIKMFAGCWIRSQENLFAILNANSWATTIVKNRTGINVIEYIFFLFVFFI
jgi:hypothetical protein